MPLIPITWRKRHSPGRQAPDLTRELVCNSFCPVASCATLFALRHRKPELSTWLTEEIGQKLGRPRFVDVEALEHWNRILVGKLRLMECKFGTTFSWNGCSGDVTWRVAQPYNYRPEALAVYYTGTASFHSRRTGCSDCKDGQERCLDDVHWCLESCFPWNKPGRFSQPDFGAMSPAQLSAWSFVVSLVSILVVAFYSNSSETVSWCVSLLSLSRSCVETALRADGVWMRSRIPNNSGSLQLNQVHSPPPPYTP